MPRPFDGTRQRPLVFRAHSRPAAVGDAPTESDIVSQELHVLVVDGVGIPYAEPARLASSPVATSRIT